MGYYEKNMEAIQKHRRLLYKAMQSTENERIVPNKEISRDGNDILTLNKDGLNFRMNSTYRPLEEVNRWVEQYDFRSKNLVVVLFGFGNGYFVRGMKEKVKKEDNVIIFEPSREVFFHVVQNYDIRDLLEDEAIHIVLGDLGWQEGYRIMGKKLHWTNIGLAIVANHPKYDDVFPEEYKRFKDICKDAWERVITYRNTEKHFSRRVVDNVVNNAKFIPGSNHLEEIKTIWNPEVPVIIVAAGPSLNDNIEELQKAKGKAVILATDKALRSLRRYGIEPDLAITIDAGKAPRLFDAVGFEDIPLICSTQSNQVVMNKHKGKKIWFECHPYVDKIYEEMGAKMMANECDHGGSVATIAFLAMTLLETKTIILVGQDLAYKGDFTHAGNVTEFSQANGKQCYVEGIDGNTVKSRTDWEFYLKWYERMLAVENAKTETVIDATEGGALIRGTKIMTLKDAIEQYCVRPSNIRERLSLHTPTFGGDGLSKVLALLESDYVELTNIIRLAKDSISNGRKAIKDYKSKKMATILMEKCAKRIAKNNEKITGKRIYLFLEELFREKNEEVLMRINDLEKEEGDRTIAIYEDMMTTMDKLIESAQELLPKMKECSKGYIGAIAERNGENEERDKRNL